MSKSVGNVITPQDLLEKHGSDAVRYWAASGRPGTDTAFVEGQMEVDRKLALKIMNASKFVLSPKLWAGKDGTEAGPGTTADLAVATAADLAARAGARMGPATEPVDQAMLRNLSGLVSVATGAFEDYDYARALERTEAWFWDFCDNYLELVKARAYGEMGPERAYSARATLAASLSVMLRLFAPFMPFVTEEVWSWWQEGSVHRAPWPEGVAPASAPGPAAYTSAVDLLASVRRAKSEAKVSPRAPVARVSFSGPPETIAALALAQDDLRAAQNISELVLVPSGTTAVDVELA
jgi:valyl-tRNA synthetase